MQECKRFAKAAMMGALNRPADRVSDPHDLLIQCFERIDALAALSLHVGDAADAQSDALGATPAGSGSRGCAPIPGAEPVAWAIYDSQGYYTTLDTEDQARHFCATYNRRKTDDPLKPYTYRPLYTSPPPGAQDMTREVCSLALAVLGSVHPEGTDPYVIEAERRIRDIEARAARGIVSGEAGETPKVARPAGQEPGCEATRPEVHVTPGYVVTGGHFVESRAQPSPGERHALPRLQVPADEGLDTNERDGKRQETPLTDLREVPTDQRPAAPPGAQEQAGVAQPSPHIEPAGWIENGKWRPNPLWSWAGPQTVAWSVPLYPAFASPTTPTEGPAQTLTVDELRGLDTSTRVRFYEHDFYPLSNFSAFTLYWRGLRFDTSEAAYHFEKFPDWPEIREFIKNAPSAHEAFKHAECNKMARRPDWDEVKVGIMRDILRAKSMQHEYVMRKLLATGDRELVEDSWRDDFWGWGPNRDGQNMLGRLWMEVRAELRAGTLTDPEGAS